MKWPTSLTFRWCL